MNEFPVDIGRDEARDAAARELSDPAYQNAQPPWFDQLMRWLVERLNDLFEGIGNVMPGGFGGVLILILLVVVVLVVIRLRVGKLARHARAEVFTGKPRSASEYRQAAEEAAARGDLAEAVRERFRAIVRGLEERGVLDERSGRTVDEVAREAGSRLPQYAQTLLAAAHMFDDVWYGGRPATVQGYQQLAELDLSLDGASR